MRGCIGEQLVVVYPWLRIGSWAGEILIVVWAISDQTRMLGLGFVGVCRMMIASGYDGRVGACERVGNGK